MFTSNSRYASAGTYTIRTPEGSRRTVTRLPVRARPAIRGLHTRTEDQRLDGLAAYYLSDATAFWRLCDAADVMAPDALGARDFVAIPVKER